jgi:hypothetical protein
MRLTEADLATFQRMSGRAIKAQKAVDKLTKPKKKPKYSNVRVLVDNIRFDSKLEARRYGELKLLQAAGQVEYFLMQVPFNLPGGIVYRLDFFIKWRSTLLRPPILTAEDCKGMRTGASADNRLAINKRKTVKALYGIDIILVNEAG